MTEEEAASLTELYVSAARMAEGMSGWERHTLAWLLHEYTGESYLITAAVVGAP